MVRMFSWKQILARASFKSFDIIRILVQKHVIPAKVRHSGGSRNPEGANRQNGVIRVCPPHILRCSNAVVTRRHRNSTNHTYTEHLYINSMRLPQRTWPTTSMRAIDDSSGILGKRLPTSKNTASTLHRSANSSGRPRLFAVAIDRVRRVSPPTDTSGTAFTPWHSQLEGIEYE